MVSFFTLVGLFAILQPAQSKTEVTLKLVAPGFLPVTTSATLSFYEYPSQNKIILDSNPQAPLGTSTFSFTDPQMELWKKESSADLVFGQDDEYSFQVLYLEALHSQVQAFLQKSVFLKCEYPMTFMAEVEVTVGRVGKGISCCVGCTISRRMLRGGLEKDCAEESDRSSVGVTKIALVVTGALLLMVGLVVVVVRVRHCIQSTSESETEMGPSIEYPPHLVGVGYADDVRECLKLNGEA